MAGAPAPTSPVAGPHRPATQPWRSPPFSNPRAASGSLLPDSFPNRISRWLHHIHPIHCHHTVPTHPRNRPITTRRPHCLVHLKIARDAPRLLGFAIYVWTIPAQVVQIYIAISASAASGRVERLQRAEPGPSSGVVPAAPFVGPNGRRLRSAWHVVAIMRRRGRVHGRRLKLRVRRPWLVVDLERGRDEQAATRRGAPFQPALEQRPDPGLTAWGLEGGVAHFGSKKCPQRPPRLCEALQNH